MSAYRELRAVAAAVVFLAGGAPYCGADTLWLSTDRVAILVLAADGSVEGLSARFVRPGRARIVADYAQPDDRRPLLQIVLDSSRIPALPAGRIWRHRTDRTLGVEYRCDSIAPGVALEASYYLTRDTYLMDVRVGLKGDSARAYARRAPLRLRISCGRHFAAGSGEGFAAGKDVPEWVTVRHGAVRRLSGRTGTRDTIRIGEWAGPRNRFFALLLRPVGYAVAVETPDHAGGGRDVVSLDPDGVSLAVRIYAGPISPFEPAAAPARPLLFASLWFWVRWLSLGMLYLLHWLTVLVRSPGLAVILLSVCVKVLICPLTRVAERWQRQVNETSSRLAPLLAEVAREYSGYERHRRTLEIYRQHGVSTIYSLKSLAGAAIQLPIFFAAYHMLHENVDLAGVSFLWIRDLAVPDHAVRLPVTVPFFGGYLNVLPLVMTALTVVTSWVHHDRSLSPELHRRQQVRLYVMAVAFLALFYTFPSGMVLYWTTNNAAALVVAVWRRWRTDNLA